MQYFTESDIFSIVKLPVLGTRQYLAYTNSNKVGVFYVKLCSFVDIQISLVLISLAIVFSRGDTLRRRCSQGCDLSLDFFIR